LSWIYLPKSFVAYRREKSYHIYVDKHWIQRVSRRRDYWKLVYTFWLFVFLNFFVEMGKISLFSLGGQDRYFGLKVDLPEAFYANKLSGKRYIKIWVDRFNNIVINDQTIKKEVEIYEKLNEQNLIDPKAIPMIIADKECRTKIIERIVMMIKYTGYRKIIFKTYPD
jgi:biopolymer transport protein ExbD